MNFLEILEAKKKELSDINEHLETLYRFAKESDIIVELGTRGLISAYSFLAAKPKYLYSVDISHPQEYGCKNFDEIIKSASEQGIEYKFLQEDSKTVKIDQDYIDLLFIDTLHTFDQVSNELKNLSHKVKKYIIFHDTVLYGVDGYGINGLEYGNGILKAINQFLENNKNWKCIESYTNNNGLMVLKNV
jgi:hypothetical protein